MDATGSAGVNRSRGTYEVPEDGAVRFSPLLSTRMAGAPAAAAQESSFLAAPAAVTRDALNGATLLLQDEDGAPLVVLRPGG